MLMLTLAVLLQMLAWLGLGTVPGWIAFWLSYACTAQLALRHLAAAARRRDDDVVLHVPRLPPISCPVVRAYSARAGRCRRWGS